MYFKIKQFFLHLINSFKCSIRDTILHDGIEHAGYLAFLFILSLFPFLIFFVSTATFLGNLDVGINFINLFIDLIPKKFLSAVMPRIDEIMSGPPQSVLTIAFIGIIWTASSAIEGIRTILNRAYRINSLPPYIWRRLLSIIQFMFFVLVIMSLVTIFITSHIMEEYYKNYSWLYLKNIIIILVIIKMIAVIYYIIPNNRQKIKNTLPGAVICFLLFSIILKLFIIYLQNFNQFNLLYGSLAGIIGTLMMFFFVGLTFIVGAEFNYHFNNIKKK